MKPEDWEKLPGCGVSPPYKGVDSSETPDPQRDFPPPGKTGYPLTRVQGLEMFATFHPHPLDTHEGLKPCPFCGSPGAFNDGERRGHDNYTVAAWCSNTSCAVRTPQHYRTREDAAYAWNRWPVIRQSELPTNYQVINDYHWSRLRSQSAQEFMQP